MKVFHDAFHFGEKFVDRHPQRFFSPDLSATIGNVFSRAEKSGGLTAFQQMGEAGERESVSSVQGNRGSALERKNIAAGRMRCRPSIAWQAIA